MWFASIWIFTLDLPWELGAEFLCNIFMMEIFASNTLGWRWVAGVQTQGKHYLASEWNIKKFTRNRFNNIKLNENAPPKVSEKIYSIIKQNFDNPQNIQDKSLLIFENSLSFETSDFHNNKFRKIYIISNKNKNRSIKLDKKVVEFKSHLINDQKQRLKNNSLDCDIIDISEIKDINEEVVGLYPTVGESLDYLNSNNIKLNYLFRKIDQYSWQYCNKGFLILKIIFLK